ncbi:alpha/beta hydrolase [Actinomycetes bacterium KLBMP 9797]
MLRVLSGPRSRAAVAVGLAAGIAAGVLPPPATAAATLELLRPTGAHPVGATTLHLTDTTRPDPWMPGVGARELMVTVWYPTHARHGTRTQYMTPEESGLQLAARGMTDLPADVFSTVRTHAYVDARPAGRAHSLPLVVLSPGHTQPRSTLSGLAEDLASHGYVVAAIDHTYETYAVTFPDGRIATCGVCAFDHEPTFRARQHQSRAADVSLVIDRLTGPNPAWRGSRLIDASRIGMSGHSAGGASAIPAMLNDPRIDAGINMDGTTSELIPASGLNRPFMFLGTPAHAPGGRDDSWDTDWSHLTGWKRWLVMAGTVHASTHDLALFADQLGIDLGATTTGARSMEITRRYNRALFDLHLRHRPQPLLDEPSARYPEVTIAAR